MTGWPDVAFSGGLENREVQQVLGATGGALVLDEMAAADA